MSSNSISATHVREQWPAISGMASGLAWSFVPGGLKNRLLDIGSERHEVINPASSKLVDSYIRWSGAPAERYATHLPPHFFSKYGMHMVAGLTSEVPYNMLSVVNQGTRMQINALIPRNEKITLRGRLVECTEDGPRVRVHTRVEVSCESVKNAMVVDTMAAVMLGKQPKKPATKRQDLNYKTVGNWVADRAEGQRFFLLTGDFNPIHTLWPFAKRSRFGGCILHGFGSYARSYEVLRDSGYEIADIDLRFVKPNLLPEGKQEVKLLDVQVAQAGRSKNKADSEHTMRLIDRDGGVYLAGRFSPSNMGA